MTTLQSPTPSMTPYWHAIGTLPVAETDTGDGLAALLCAALDHIDCGILLVDAQMRTVHVNRHGRSMLPPAAAAAGSMRWPLADPLARQASQALLHGRRSLVPFPGHPDEFVMVVPLPGPDGHPAAVLLVSTRRDISSPVTLGLFARHHGLTLAETQVLQALVDGLSPGAIARQQGVAECTTRTHVSSLRQKIGSSAITDVLRQVARLPPVGALVG